MQIFNKWINEEDEEEVVTWSKVVSTAFLSKAEESLSHEMVAAGRAPLATQ